MTTARAAAATAVADPDDPRLVDYRELRSPAAREAFEADRGCFVAEGPAVVRRLFQSGLRVRSVLVLAGKEHHVAGIVPDGVAFYVVGREVLTRLAGFDVHRGVLASADRPPPRPLDALAASTRRLAVLEGLNDHENLGAIARSAWALGIDGLVLDPTCADPWYRRAVRVSMGEMMFLPLARAARWPDDLGMLRAAGFTLAALTPSPDAEPLAVFARRALPTPGARIALLLGAEGPGLSAAALAACDTRVRIPIRPGVDSLNVGHAAAVAFNALGTLAGTGEQDGEPS